MLCFVVIKKPVQCSSVEPKVRPHSSGFTFLDGGLEACRVLLSKALYRGPKNSKKEHLAPTIMIRPCVETRILIILVLGPIGSLVRLHAKKTGWTMAK